MATISVIALWDSVVAVPRGTVTVTGPPGPPGASAIITVGATPVTGGTATYLLSTDGSKVTLTDPATLARLDAANTFDPIQVFGHGIQITDAGSTRKGTHTWSDAGAEHRLGSTGMTGYATVLIRDTYVQIGGSQGAPLVIQQSGGFVLSGSVAGGVGAIQLGRRLADSHPACGATIEGWTANGQMLPAFAVMAPGGGSYLSEWRPNGAFRNAHLADGTADADTVYFSKEASALVYQDSTKAVRKLQLVVPGPDTDPHYFQRQMDTVGAVSTPIGTWNMPHPLFLNGENKTVTGVSFGLSILKCDAMATAVVVGLKRGTISDAHYTSEGFRTLNDCHLHSRGTEADLGPFHNTANVTTTWPNTGWAIVKKLTFDLDVESFNGAYSGGAIWTYTTNGQPIPVAGMSDGHEGYAPNPRPYFIYWQSGILKIAFRLTDGIQRVYRVPTGIAAPNVARMSLRIEVDSVGGTVRCGPIDAATTTACVADDVTTSGAPAMGGQGFIRNTEVAFGFGHCTYGFSDIGYFGSFAETVPVDWLIRRFDVLCDGTGLMGLCHTEYTGRPAERPATYVGGPSLPLLTAYYLAGGGRYFIVVHRGQTNCADGAVNCTIENVTLHGTGNNVTVLLMAGYNLLINQCTSRYGTRNIGTSSLDNVYPLNIVDCYCTNAVDCNIHLFRMFRSTITRTNPAYGQRCGIELIGCDIEVSNGFHAPSGDGTIVSDPETGGTIANFPTAAIVQRGGFVSLIRFGDDIESPADASFSMMKVYPDTYDQPTFKTTTRLQDCQTGVPVNSLIRVFPRAVGYDSGHTQVTVIVDGVNYVTEETPTGLVNGSNTVFNAALAFVPETVEVFKNKAPLRIGTNFTTTGPTTVTFSVAPATGDIVRITYGKL